jgi:hypothetical protein
MNGEAISTWRQMARRELGGDAVPHVLERGWPVRRLVCREYDRVLLDVARKNLEQLVDDQEDQQFDFNNPEAMGYEQFDVAFLSSATRFTIARRSSGSFHFCLK